MRNHLPVGALGQRQLWINIHCAPFPASLGLCFTTQTSHGSGRAPGLSSFHREMANTLRKQQVGFFSPRQFWTNLFGKQYHVLSSQWRTVRSQSLLSRCVARRFCLSTKDSRREIQCRMPGPNTSCGASPSAQLSLAPSLLVCGSTI